MNEIQFASITKLIVCFMVLISATLLLMTNKIDPAAGVGLISGVLGYVFGNGHGVVSAKKAKNV